MRMKKIQNRFMSFIAGNLPLSTKDSQNYNSNKGKAANIHDLHSTVLNHLTGVKHMNMLKSDGNDNLDTPELLMNECDNLDKEEPVGLVPPVITSSELLLCTNEDDLLDYEPELIVFYKEINCDDGSKIYVEEMFIEDKGLIDLNLDQNVVSPVASKCLTKGKGNDVSDFASKFTFLADLRKMDDQNPEALLQSSGKDAENRIDDYLLDEKSTVTRALPIKTLSRLRISHEYKDEARQLKQEINYNEGHSANTFEAQRTGIDGNTVCEGQNADIDGNVENIHQKPCSANKIVNSDGLFLPNDCKNLSETMSWANCEVLNAGTNEVAGNVSFTYQGEACEREVITCSVSCQINDTGYITYGGSSSMQSNSNTTSARSFSFPRLQTEWNGSPVRMGGANKGRLRKMYGSWKQGFLCCRL